MPWRSLLLLTGCRLLARCAEMDVLLRRCIGWIRSAALLWLVAGFALGLVVAQGLSPQQWLWPLALVITAVLLARALVLVARLGIRVEIVSHRPLEISTQRRPIQAEVTRVRL